MNTNLPSAEGVLPSTSTQESRQPLNALNNNNKSVSEGSFVSSASGGAHGLSMSDTRNFERLEKEILLEKTLSPSQLSTDVNSTTSSSQYRPIAGHTASHLPLRHPPPPPTRFAQEITSADRTLMPQAWEQIAEMAGQLRARIALIDQNWVEFKERERVSVEVLNSEKQRVKNLETDLRQEKDNFTKEKNEFEEFKSKELSALKKSRENVEKLKAAVEKKESEQVKVLKEQNDICERDARCSSQRAKIRQLEIDLNRAKDDAQEAKLDVKRLNERIRTLEDSNTQMRLRKNSNSNLKSSEDTAVKRRQSSVSTNKSVRFNLLSKASSQETQTSFLEPSRPPVGVSTGDANSAPIMCTEQQSQTSSSVPFASGMSVVMQRTLADGSTETVYTNGTTCVQSADVVTVTYRYANGDSRRVLPTGTEIYSYAANGLTTVTEPTGEMTLQWADGREERHLADGTKEIRQGSRCTVLSPDGRQHDQFPDGTTVIRNTDGAKVVCYPDGRKETQFADYARCEYPSGDVKLLYNDGTVETRYADGRVRVKDAHGKLLRYDYAQAN